MSENKDYKAAFVRDVEERLVRRYDPDDVAIISNIIICALNDYDMSARCTDIVPYDDENERVLKRYVSCLIIDGKSKGTIKQYTMTLRRLADVTHKNYAKMGINDVRYFLACEIERGLSDRSRENQRANVSAFFQWMTAEEIIPKNPIAALKPIKYKEEVKLPFSDIDIDKLRSACINLKERAIIETLLATGIRVEEACFMNASDVNKDTLAVHVTHGKGNKERVTYITPVAMRHLSAYLNSRSEDNDILFCNRYHNRLTDGGIRKLLKRIEARTDVTDVHPHRFRRTFATNLYRRGMDIHEIQRLMGHSNINTTMEYIYVEDTRIFDSYKRHIA